MSVVQPPVPERRPSPSLGLATNNPFRARLSGVPLSPASATDRFSFASSGRERPQSRNPFLDVFDDDNEFDFGNEQRKPSHRSNSFDVSSSHRPQLQPQLTGSAAELFENLTISDHSGTQPPTMQPVERKPALPQYNSRPPPPPGRRRRNSRSSDDEPAPLISVSTWDSSKETPRGPPPSNRRPLPPGSRNGPSERSREPRRRPRRNSDSSVIDAHETEHRERSRRDRDGGRRDRDRDRDRDQKSRGERDRDTGSTRRREGSTDKRKKNAALDVIDKLDVTGIYGSGLFHHDGPFDACNPHRNKSTRRLAPVHAFPADSANNSMSGFGPLNKKADHSHVFGNRDPEAFNDYTTGPRPTANRATSFDPKAAIETVHGDESLGLGTSTFLDGAPASKIAMQRTISDSMDDRPRSSSEGGVSGGGLQRKKSLAQKIRGMKTGAPSDAPISSRRRAPPPPGGPRSPGVSPTTPVDGNGEDPFFNDYDDAYDRKGESITVVERRRDRAPSSPKKPHPGITRVNTDEGTGNGLMKRVRSLSKSKRRND
ncbi:Pal1 cell morphology protein-domain-containing protein [Geopyxis carbonaria]|nr:Pal1 cell morphology protein-domain-containing protein [Geopyxis carbonaria]